MAKTNENVTLTISRAALADLLVTAASLGRDFADAGTRGEVANKLAAYGLVAETPLRLAQAIEAAESSVASA